MVIKGHAKKRIKERCGLPKKAMERNANKALNEGILHTECTGRLRKYVDYLFLSHGKGGNIRLYGNHVYIFTKTENLITVLPLPNAHKDAVNKALQRRITEARTQTAEQNRASSVSGANESNLAPSPK